MRPRTGWRTCWLAMVRARDSVWRCCWSARPRRSWRCWRCSRPGRRICRSTRRSRRPDRVHARRCRPGRRGHHRGAGRRGWTGATCWSSMSRTPHRHPAQHRVAGAGRRRYRLPHLHLGHHRCPEGGGRHPPQRDPVAGVTGRRPARRRAVWTQCHSYAFDFSVWEIWGALLGGGRLVVVPE